MQDGIPFKRPVSYRGEETNHPSMSFSKVRQREGNFVQNVDKSGGGKSLGVHKENVATTPQKLHFYHQLDPWQQDNHFIRSGYVKHTGSYTKCFQSLGYWHNETVNIYSHLLPSSILLLSVLYYINYQLTMYPNYLGIWEKWNFVQFGVACTFCLFMSSVFHCVKSHSHKVSKFGNQLDYFGIIILITCSLISIVLFTYYDSPQHKYAMCGVFLVLGSICTVMTLNRKFATNHYRPIRSAMFILFGLSGVLPIVVGARIYGADVIWDRACMGWLILEGVFYIGGAVLYAARFPERLTHVDEDEHTVLENPRVGKFDIVGHSHQIFHVLVVVAAFCHWQALVGCYHYLHQVTLPAMNV